MSISNVYILIVLNFERVIDINKCGIHNHMSELQSDIWRIQADGVIKEYLKIYTLQLQSLLTKNKVFI